MRARLSHAFFLRHPGQLLLALIGIAAGMAVVTGVALLRGSLVQSLDAASDALAGPDAVTLRASDGPIAPGAYAALATRTGAPDLVPVLRIPVQVAGVQLEVVGVDPFGGVADGRSVGPAALAGLQWDGTGSPPALVGPETRALIGLEEPGPIDAVGPDGPVALTVIDGPVTGAVAALDRRLLMDIAAAQHAFGQPRAITELLAPAEAADWLQAHLPPGLVLSRAAEQRASARRLTAGLRANLTAMSLLALATGLFVVYSVLSFLMVQRRRTFGVLRAIGLTHRDLARMLIQEGLALGVLGSLLGLVAGTLLADRLLALVAGPVRSIYGQLALARTAPTLELYAVLFAIGALAAVAVTIPVAREALRVPPGRLLRDAPEARDRRPAWLTPLLAASGVIAVIVDSGLYAALAGLFLVLAGLASWLPALGFRVLAAGARRLGRGLAGRAIGLLVGSQRRLGPALSALSLALALAMGMGMMILGFRGAVDDWVQRLLRADLYVSAPERTLAPDDVAALEALDGVAAVSTVRSLRLIDGTRLTAYRLPREAWAGFEWLAGDAEAIRAGFERGRGVAISEPLARARSLAPGNDIELPFAGGVRRMTVLGVFRDYSSDAGFVAIDARQVADAVVDPGEVDSVGLYRASEVDPGALERSVQALAERRGFRWIGPDAIRDQSLSVFDRTFRISWAMALLVGGIALVALVSALLAHGLERARDYATLRALGLEPRRLFLLVVAQTLGLTAAAALLAVPTAALVHYALVLFVQPRAFGWTVPASLPPVEPILVVIPLALVLGALAGLVPAARIASRPPAASLRALR
ncbi:FtsX-like permease family protein [Halomonas denitrificans]|nr:FtsX-like permease family protein [Halomonas denitrificans]